MLYSSCRILALVVACENALIKATPRQQLFVPALIDKPAVLEDENAVGPANLAEPMRDEQGCAPILNALNGRLNTVFGGTVDGAGRIVKNQDSRIG